MNQARILTWKYYNVHEIDCILASQTNDELAKFFENHLQMNLMNETDKIIINYFCNSAEFAKESNFTKEKLSTFLGILLELHERNIENPNDNIDELMLCFKGLLICHTLKQPPFSIKLFNVTDTIKITNYVTKTYLKHYKLYKYIFIPNFFLNINLEYENNTNSSNNNMVMMEKDERNAFNEQQQQQQGGQMEESSLAKTSNSSITIETARDKFERFLRDCIDELKSVNI